MTTSSTPSRRWRPTRRGFLLGMGIAGGSLALGISLGLPRLRTVVLGTIDSGSYTLLPDMDAWLWFEIGPDSRMKLYVNKIEMGQGVHTALAQIAAEELGVDWAYWDVVQATTAIGPPDPMGTLGSISVQSLYEPLRQTAAHLRVMLLDRAAHLLEVPRFHVQLQDHYAVDTQGNQRIALWDLVSSPWEWQVPDEERDRKAVADFTVIGQSMPRVDLKAKVTGQAIYGYDARLPSMQYGAVLRPPTLEGRMQQVDTWAVRNDPDIHIVQRDQFVGVVAPSRLRARQALQQLDVTWDPGRPWNQAALEAMVRVDREGDGAVTLQTIGNAASALAEATSLEVEYSTPFALQSPMEPQTALADVQPDRTRAWVSTQLPETTRQAVAEATGHELEDVEIIPTYLGGGFGRKMGNDVAREAALLSQATGVPVHVGWDRSEELRSGFMRPPTHHRLFARLDAGRIQAWEHHQASGDVLLSFFPPVAAAALGADIGALRGARIHYAVPNRRVLAWRRQLPVPTGSWRGLGLFANIFALESFMDEMAQVVGQDPVQFRLDHLANDDTGQRLRQALTRVADEAGWGRNLPEDHAQGVACCIDNGTVVAMIAEVSAADTTGQYPRIHKITAVMDCGLVINPDGARAQLEGNIMWGVSATLMETVRIEEGRILPGNFDLYPILAMEQAPQIQALLQVTGEKPYGVGEPAIGPVPAAITNAWFALTGQRVRHLPMEHV